MYSAFLLHFWTGQAIITDLLTREELEGTVKFPLPPHVTQLALIVIDPAFSHPLQGEAGGRIKPTIEFFSCHLYSKFFEIFFLVEYSNSIIMQFEPFSYNFLRLSNF